MQSDSPLRRTLLRTTLLTVLAAALPVRVRAAFQAAATIPVAELIEPEALAALLATPGAKAPLVLQVGARVLYEQGHVSGAEYAGTGSLASGVQSLGRRVARLPKATPIVIYCGCCPWDHCPNIAPAHEALQERGFRHVRALHIAEDFGTDWVDRGYPTTQGA